MISVGDKRFGSRSDAATRETLIAELESLVAELESNVKSSPTGAANMGQRKNIYIVPSERRLLMWSAVSIFLYLGAAVCVRAQDAKQSNDESWLITRDTAVANSNPMRTTESHSKSGNRTVDTQRVEVLGPDNRFQPSSETEAETIQVDATTKRTVVRTYTWNGNGRRQLWRITEEESQTTPNGGAHVVRKTSAADVNGSVQVVQREVQHTRKIGSNVEETTSTVSRPDSYGGFSQSEQTQELKTRGADEIVQATKARLVPDGNGNWKVAEVTENSIRDDGKNRTTDERILQPDLEGRLYEKSRTVSNETETATGEKKSTVETYSDYVPGYRYSSEHLNQGVTTIQKKGAGGEVIEEQIEQPSAGNPDDSPKVTMKTKYVVKYGFAGTEQSKTVEQRGGGGNFYVVSVETQKSDKVSAAQKP